MAATEPKPVCPLHGSELPPSCAECEAIIARPVEDMTSDERADELAQWMAMILTVNFSTLHERTEKLVGRPVWTHEFANPEPLITEARTQAHPNDLESYIIHTMDQAMGPKPVIIVRPDKEAI